MIAFDLRCGAGHQFEGWFASSAAYEAQNGADQICCPLCNDTHVIKAPSAPFIGRKGNQVSLARREAVHQSAAPVSNIATTEPTAPITNSVIMPEVMQQMVEKLAVMQHEVLKDSNWVGRQFAEEARAIHYGETENRMIHGEASPQEATDLAEEGVSIAPLPFPILPPLTKN